MPPLSASVLALSTDNLTNVPRAPATKPAAAAADAPAPEMPVVVPGVLAVPVQVWRALEARLATLETNERDTRKYLRAHLALCLLYTSPSPRDVEESRMPSSA